MWVAVPAVALALAVWVWRLRRRLVPPQTVAALADRACDAGGLLMTQSERPLGEWDAQLAAALPRMALPRVAWGPTSTVWNAAVFLVLALTLPLPQPFKRPPNIAAAARLEDLKAQADALEAEQQADQSLKAELERLQQELEKGEFGAADWESADGVESKLQQDAAEASAALARAAQSAEALESALKDGATGEQSLQAREALEQALTELTKKTAAAQASSKPANGSPANGVRPQSASQLRQALEQRQRALEKAFDKNGQGQGASEPRPDPAHSPPDKQKGGNGKSSRGGESRDVFFEGPGAEDPARLAFQPLPRGQGEADQVWGMSSADAKPSHQKLGAARGSANAADGDPAHLATGLLPANRELVRQYFGTSSRDNDGSATSER